MKRLLKIFSLIVLAIVLVLIVAIYWPLPELKVPESHNSILIKSINIIDVKSGDVLVNRDIYIEDNTIISMDSSGLQKPNAELILDGSGKFVIPGLWDMHTHSNQYSEWLHHPLYIANGVTGIRDMSGQLDRKDSYWVGSRERLQWNKELNNNERVAPRYVLQSSYQIDGASSVPNGFPEYFKLEIALDADSLLNFYKNEGVDFIKVYQQIRPESYKRLAIEAPKYGIHLAGHKPIFISLEEATQLGQKSFEHGRIFMYESFPKADSLRDAKDWKGFFSKSKRSMVDEFDPAIALGLMSMMKEKNAHWTPTLQTLKFEAFAHEDSFLDNPNLNYVTTTRKKLWWGIDARNNKKRNLAPEGKGLSLKFYQAAQQQIKMAHDLGVPIMAGTDVTDSYIIAGFSIHDELEDLTNCGLSPIDALRAATIIPAKYAGMAKNYGSIEPGKIADLVILNGSPLDQIRQTKSISGVILNGIYYDPKALKELKHYAESIASSFHMNIKVFSSFVRSPLIRVQFAD